MIFLIQQAILLTVRSSEKCGVAIDGIQPSLECFRVSTDQILDSPTSEGVGKGTEDNSALIAVSVVATCIVLLVLGLAAIVVGLATRSRHHSISTQRPKSIHIHHRLPHGGDSVTSFSPESG